MSEFEPILETISSQEDLIRKMIEDLHGQTLDNETRKKYMEELKKIFDRSKNLIPYLQSKKYPKVEEEIRVAKMIEEFFKEQNLL